MLEILIKKCNENEQNLEELSIQLEKISLQELIDVYLGYSHSIYFMRYGNISKILDLVGEKIIEKLPSVSLIEAIDLFLNFYINTINIVYQTEQTQNRLNVEKENIASENFGKKEALKANISREKFLSDYIAGIKYNERILECQKKALSYMDKLQDFISRYIDITIQTISDEDKKLLLQNINEKIEDYSKEIVKRNIILNNEIKLRIQSKLLGKNIFEVKEELNTKELESRNDVYKNYQAVLLELLNKKKK